ncbi:MAG: TRAP transporter small permease subunit [Rhodospirillaceae bacterium]
MNRLLLLMDRLCFFGAAVAALLLAMLFFLGALEIVLRSAFQISLPFAVEYAGYLLVLVLFLGSGWTLSQGEHVRVTLLREHVSPVMAYRLDIAAVLVALCIAIILTASLFTYAMGTWFRGTVSYFPSETPLALPQFFLSFGPLTLCIALCARLIRLIRGEDRDPKIMAENE